MGQAAPARVQPGLPTQGGARAQHLNIGPGTAVASGGINVKAEPSPPVMLEASPAARRMTLSVRTSRPSGQNSNGTAAEVPPLVTRRLPELGNLALTVRKPPHVPNEGCKAEEDSDSDEETDSEPPPANVRMRKGGVSAEGIVRGFYREPYWNKHTLWEEKLSLAFESCHVFAQFTSQELDMLVRATQIHKRFQDDTVDSHGCIGEQGELTDALYVILEGSVHVYKEGGVKRRLLVGTRGEGQILDESAVLFATPRPNSYYAQGVCTLGKLRRVDYINLAVRLEYNKRADRQAYLQKTPLLEMMEDEQIAKLADVLKVGFYSPGDYIIKQGEEGHVFFIMQAGTAKAEGRTGNDTQEYCRYGPGDLFGEVALMENKPRAVSVIAVTRVEVFYLSRRQFERLFGPMEKLKAQQYLTDPRKLIADFYRPGDSRGPAGSVKDKQHDSSSLWFAVYRPTSRDAIAKMLSGLAVGKGLNIKGKSAKQGVLSGYVPFVQISDNKHKAMIEECPPHGRAKVYYKQQASLNQAKSALESVLDTASKTLRMDDPTMKVLTDYEPLAFGLDMPAPLLREAYIMRSDLSPWMGWETGRRSEPMYMDMNFHSLLEPSEPRVVLYQMDDSEPMNPRGLLVAYAEQYVKPVVSDFDTFLVASQGMKYEYLPEDQAKLVIKSLECTKKIFETPNTDTWTSRWMSVLKEWNAAGFHPKPPKFGFCDPTSYRLIGDVVRETAACGAIRHGAECCNFTFPQELDDSYLVVWEHFPDTPWMVMDEEHMRNFLLERIRDGFAFPLNPIWCVRDKGWYEVLQALMENSRTKEHMKYWLPEDSGIMEMINQLHHDYPKGFEMLAR